jgi:hypothetical protein
MTPSLDRGVQDLGREYPEWKPWLSVIEEVLREAADRNWEAFVPERPEPQQSKVPLLAGLTCALENNRVHRCGRCGGKWQLHCLSCPYCGMSDHTQLISLVPEKSGSNCVVDACKRCLGYVKTFTTLQGSPPVKIMLDDLATVNFDLAALEQGYKRPEGSGYCLETTVHCE